MLRTHTCGQLRSSDVGQTVTLCGWVDSYRDHKGVLFVDLRDRYGKTQVVFGPEAGDENQELARTLRSRVRDLRHRQGGASARGDRQSQARHRRDRSCAATEVDVLNNSQTPPFQPGGEELPGEDLRLKYRYLDLRRPEMQRMLMLRHRIDQGDARLFRRARISSTSKRRCSAAARPRGPAIIWCPAACTTATFYALPQSPQLYKQILMVAGYDRYVQVARCFRDEDLRADRQPEFTQLDLEMSFVDADDVIGIIDGLVARLAHEVLGLEVKLPLPRMTYDEAMERFGHDAPDLRFGMELVDLTDLAERDASSACFAATAEAAGACAASTPREPRPTTRARGSTS